MSSQLAQVLIDDFEYEPDFLVVQAGTTVQWTNVDGPPHTVTSDSGTELNSGNINHDQQYSHTFNTSGTYHYHCELHPEMTGTVVVID